MFVIITHRLVIMTHMSCAMLVIITHMLVIITHMFP